MKRNRTVPLRRLRYGAPLFASAAIDAGYGSDRDQQFDLSAGWALKRWRWVKCWLRTSRSEGVNREFERQQDGKEFEGCVCGRISGESPLFVFRGQSGRRRLQ